MISASAWLKTDSGSAPVATALTSPQPLSGLHAGPGMPLTCRAPGSEHCAGRCPSAQVSPVGSPKASASTGGPGCTGSLSPKKYGTSASCAAPCVIEAVLWIDG